MVLLRILIVRILILKMVTAIPVLGLVLAAVGEPTL
jgi:hypothetical protein